MADPYAGRRYSDRTGKGLYEDQVDGLSSTLRQAFSGGGAPRKTEGVIAPAAASQLQPQSSQKTDGVQNSLSQGDLRKLDAGGDARRPGLMAGYSATQTGAPGVTRVDGGSNPLFTNIDPREAVEGLRGGTVSSVGDTNEGLARMARANAIRQEYLDSFGGPKAASIGGGGAVEQFNEMYDARREGMRRGLRPGQVLARDRDYSSALGSFLRNQASESDRQANVAIASMREEGANARDAARLGLDRERFEFEKTPKPMGALDQVRLAEAQYGLRERVADRARKELEGRGLTPDQQNRVLENVGESLVDTDPARMQTELAKHLPTLRATDIANQYNIGGVTSTGDVTPVGLRGYRLSEVDLFGNDDPNAPTFSEYLWNLANDKAIVEDSAGDADGKPVRLINAARVKASGDGKNIDLLRRLGIK